MTMEGVDARNEKETKKGKKNNNFFGVYFRLNCFIELFISSHCFILAVVPPIVVRNTTKNKQKKKFFWGP